MVNMWTDSKRVHPVPESSLLSGLTLSETIRDRSKPLGPWTICLFVTCMDMGESLCERGIIHLSLLSRFQSWFSGLVRAGCLLKSVATKAMLSFAFPDTTSVAVTNCRQSRRSAWLSIQPALFMRSFSWWHKQKESYILLGENRLCHLGYRSSFKGFMYGFLTQKLLVHSEIILISTYSTTVILAMAEETENLQKI